MLDADRPCRVVGLRPQGANLSGIDQGVLDALALQDSRRAVGRESLRDPVQRDRRSRAVQADMPGGDLHAPPVDAPAGPLDGRGIGEAALPRRRGIKFPERLHRDVECPARALRDLGRPAQHRHQVGMRAVKHSLAVQPAKLAVRPVEAHHVLDQVQLRKRGVDRAVSDLGRFVQGRHRDGSAQRLGRPANRRQFARAAPTTQAPASEAQHPPDPKGAPEESPTVGKGHHHRLFLAKVVIVNVLALLELGRETINVTIMELPLTAGSTEVDSVVVGGPGTMVRVKAVDILVTKIGSPLATAMIECASAPGPMRRTTSRWTRSR